MQEIEISPHAMNRKLNWRPSVPNINAFRLVSPGLPESDLPQEKDLESEFTAAYDQLQIGSCADNAGGSIIERKIILTKYKWQFRPSRLFMYWNARDKEGTTASDAGSTLADVFAAANEFGVCPEIEDDNTDPNWVWSYVDDGVKFKTRPPEQCYKDAVLHRVLKDEVVSLDRNTVLNALAADKPFAFGFSVHKSFMSQQMANTGVMHVPDAFDIMDPFEGGHAVVAMGYKLNNPMGSQGIKDWVKVRNSWGTKWAIDGYFWMPLDQILCNPQVSSDAHAVDMVGYS